MRWLRGAIKAYTSKFVKPDESRGIFNNKSGYGIKLIVVGDWHVGKSSFLHRIAEDKFEVERKNTIGMDFFLKRIEIDGQPIVVKFIRRIYVLY